MSRSCPDGSDCSDITSSHRVGSCSQRRLRKLTGNIAARRSSSFISGCVSGGVGGSGGGGGSAKSRRWLSCQCTSSSRGPDSVACADGVDASISSSSSSSSSSICDVTSSRSRRIFFAAAHNRSGNNLPEAKDLNSAFLNVETESELIYSGHQEGYIGLDLDAVKSAISRMSIYEEAFFKESLERDRFYMEELGFRQSFFRLPLHEAAEIHLSLDQADGSEIMVPSQTTADMNDQATMRWRVITWLGYRRRWLASLGHTCAGAVCDNGTELSFSGSSGDDAGCLRLQLNFQPEGGEDASTAAAAIRASRSRSPSPSLVMRLNKLAFNLRRLLLSGKLRPPEGGGGAKQGKSSS